MNAESVLGSRDQTIGFGAAAAREADCATTGAKGAARSRMTTEEARNMACTSKEDY
jgi:ribosomal protein S5